MPNWCDNTLTITGPKDELWRFLRINQGEDSDLSFKALIPTPTDSNIDWNIDHWGTKWDIDSVRSGTLLENEIDSGAPRLTYKFLSAWSPPVEWLRTIRPLFPELEFVLEYYEGGMGFVGMTTSVGPVDIFDEERQAGPEDAHHYGYHDSDPQINCEECNIDDFDTYHEEHKNQTEIEEYVIENCPICLHNRNREHPGDGCSLCPANLSQRRNPDEPMRQAFTWMHYTWDIDQAEKLIANRRKKIPPEMINVDELYASIRWHPQVLGILINREYAMTKADTSKPLIMGLIKSEGQWFHILIDGHHRLYRAKHEGIKELPAHLLTKSENYKSSIGRMRPPIRKI